ncbi:MAG: PRC-barrel domain-containing protein [Sphingobium sp.]|nr:PRC-barrel domain-containing protein [Sphingobium sp.]
MADTIDRQQGHHHLIASDRVEGTAVYNNAGERLGTIKNFMVDKVSGRAEFAVMQFGGLFGVGSDYYPIPWDMLVYNVDKGGYAVELDKARLEQAPRYGEPAAGHDNDYADMVRSYYDRQPAPFI